MNALPDAVAEPRVQRNVAYAWESFLSTGECNRALVRDLILFSWQRCASGATETPRRSMPMVEADGLQRSREASAEMMHAVQEVLGGMREVLDATRSVILLTDAAGVILDSFGARKHVDHAAERNLRAGGNCHEVAGGTNAIGTALAVGHAMQVHASEHFYEYVKGWTCSASLIRDPLDRSVLGVLDISGTKDTFNAHNLALAVSLSSQIERQLGFEDMRIRSELLAWSRAQSARWPGEATLTLDRKGRVVGRDGPLEEALRGLGVAADVRAGSRLAAASATPPAATPRDATAWPEWVRLEWVQSWRGEGAAERGYLVVIPHARAQRPIARAPLPPTESAEGAAPAAAALSDAFAGIVGDSAGLRRCVARARRLAAGDFPVLILGETGVGKEEIALAMHRCSPVAGGPFVAVNCGALPRELALSELFGYAEGAFTGAARGGRAGKFEHAHRGTLFLDEIGDLPPEVQVQLLRVLQDGDVTRLGESRPRRVSVRVLSATNADLRAAVERGSFRKDLYFRLASASVDVPALRQRGGDVALLAHHFLDRLSRKYRVPEKRLGGPLLARLQNRPWPGNVRELKNLLETLWQLSDGDALDVGLLAECDGPDAASTCDGGGLPPLQRSEREEIASALRVHAGNVSKTARYLGIARSTLYLKMSKYGIAS